MGLRRRWGYTWPPRTICHLLMTKSSPKIKLKMFVFCRPHHNSGLGNFQRTKGKTVVSSTFVQKFNISNHKTIGIISLFWHDCGLEGHEIAELVIRFSNSDKSKLFTTYCPIFRLDGFYNCISQSLSLLRIFSFAKEELNTAPDGEGAEQMGKCIVEFHRGPSWHGSLYEKETHGIFLPFFSGYSRVTLICHDWDISLVSRHKATLRKGQSSLRNVGC